MQLRKSQTHNQSCAFKKFTRLVGFFWTTALSFCFSFSAWGYTHFQDTNAQKQLSVAWWPASDLPLVVYVDGDSTTVPGKTWFQVVKQACDKWSSIPGSSIKLLPLTLLKDINVSNFSSEIKVGDGRKEIILSKTGALMESLGLDSQFVAGVGIPFVNKKGKPTDKQAIAGKIVDAYVIINGKLTWNAERMERVLLHEIGHLLGLGHSNIVHTVSTDDLPIMFYSPLQTSGEVRLHEDDKAGIASLYPAANFETEYGIIRGQIKRSNGKPVFGLAVVAEPLKGGDGVAGWTDNEGRYEIAGLKPGKYLVHARAIDASTSMRGLDPSVHIGGIYKSAEKEFCPEMYGNQPYEFCRIQPRPRNSSVLVLKAGQTLSGVDIVEGKIASSSVLKCSLGAWPQLQSPGRNLSPPSFPGDGKRGETCVVNRLEPFEKTSDAGREVIPEYRSPETRQDSRDGLRSLDSKEPGTGCFCSSQHSFEDGWMGFLWVMGVLLWVRRRNHRNI